MSEQLLIVTIAGRRVAVQSLDIQSLIELDTLVPVPRTPPHIAGLSALRSRMLTVIDSTVSLGLVHNCGTDQKREAMVVEHEGHCYALLVDGVVDVTEALSAPQPVDADLGRGWKLASAGMVETAHGPLLLLNIARIIEGQDMARAA